MKNGVPQLAGAVLGWQGMLQPATERSYPTASHSTGPKLELMHPSAYTGNGDRQQPPGSELATLTQHDYMCCPHICGIVQLAVGAVVGAPEASQVGGKELLRLAVCLSFDFCRQAGRQVYGIASEKHAGKTTMHSQAPHSQLTMVPRDHLQAVALSSAPVLSKLCGAVEHQPGSCDWVRTSIGILEKRLDTMRCHPLQRGW